MGVVLATLGKALVVKEESFKEAGRKTEETAEGIKETKEIKKIAASEVRYNSKSYVELIARVQAANRIKTYIPDNYETSSIWMTSFLIFTYDLYGGEYVTSSHAISTKIATKDLNNEGIH